MAHSPLFASRFNVTLRCLLLATLAFVPAGRLPAQQSEEPIDFGPYPEYIVAPIRLAWCSAWSPDDEWVATSYGVYQGNLGTLRVWDAKSGKVRWEVTERRGIRRVVVSPDGSIVASGNWGGVIHLRNAATGRLLKTLEGVDQTVHGLAFSSDGRRLVSCGGNHKLHIWDVATGEVRTTLEGHTNVANGVQFSPDDKLLLSYGRDRSLRIWNADDGQQLRLIKHPQEVRDAAFVQGGKQIATACDDGLVRVHQVDSGDFVTSLPGNLPGRTPVTAITVSSDGTFLAAADARVRIWKTETWESVSTLDPMGFVAGLAFSKDAKSLLISNGEASVNVWDVPDKRQRLTFPLAAEIQAGAGQVRSLAILPNGNQIATADGENHCTIRDRRTGKILRSLDAKDAVKAVAISPNGKTMVTAGDDGAVYTWDATTMKLKMAQRVHKQPVTSLVYSPQGQTLASGATGGGIALWNTSAPTLRKVLNGHGPGALALGFLPDGSGLISGSADQTIRIWRAARQRSQK